MNIKLYKKELHEKQIQDYLLENPEDSSLIGERGVFTESDATYWDLKLVYVKDDKVVGLLFSDSCSVQKLIDLSQLLVFKEHRKKGIAKEMFDFMEIYYRKLEMNHIKVMYYENNDIGKFYKNLGFQDHFIAEYGTIKGGEWIKNINLIKFLGQRK